MYRLLKLGVSVSEQAELPMSTLDWLLAIDDVYIDVANDDN